MNIFELHQDEQIRAFVEATLSNNLAVVNNA